MGVQGGAVFCEEALFERREAKSAYIIHYLAIQYTGENPTRYHGRSRRNPRSTVAEQGQVAFQISLSNFRF